MSFVVRTGGSRTTTAAPAPAAPPTNPDGSVKRCRCGVPAKQLVVKKDGPNHGRPFLACGRGGTGAGGCTFFEFIDGGGGGGGGSVGGSAGAIPRSPPPAAGSSSSAAAAPFSGTGHRLGGGGASSSSSTAPGAPPPPGGAPVPRTHKVTFAADGGPGSFTAETRYRDDIVRVMRAHHGRFNADARTWAFPLEAHEHLRQGLTAIRDVLVLPLPPDVLRALRAHAAAAAADGGGGDGGQMLGTAPAPPSSSAAARPSAVLDLTSDGDGSDSRSSTEAAANSAAARHFGAPVVPTSGATAAASIAAASSSSAAAAAAAPPPAVNVNPALWHGVLHGFQRDGVLFCIGKRGRVMINDEPGVGKTTTSLTTAAHYRFSWPLLVICPSSLRLNWVDELLARLGEHEGLRREDIHVIASGKDALPPPVSYGPPAGLPLEQAKAWGYVPPPPGAALPPGGLAALPPHPGVRAGVAIISYDIATTYADRGALRPGQFRFVIADESHALKSLDAKRTRVCLPLLQQARFALLLSGTPALNRPKELFTQIAAVNPRLFPDYRAFSVRYCAGRQAVWGWDDSGCSNPTELNSILEREMMLRRRKATVLADLPPKRRRVFPVATTPGATAQLAALRKETEAVAAKIRAAKSEDERAALQRAAQGLLTQQYRTTGIGKLPAVVAHILRIVEPDARAVPARWASAKPGGRGAGGGSKKGAGGGGGGKRRRVPTYDEAYADGDSDGEDEDAGFARSSGGGAARRGGRAGDSESDDDGGDRRGRGGASRAAAITAAIAAASKGRSAAGGGGGYEDDGEDDDGGGGFFVDDAATSAAASKPPAPGHVICIDDSDESSNDGTSRIGAMGGAAAAAASSSSSSAAAPRAAAGGSGSNDGEALPRVKKLLVFAHHKEVLEYITAALERHDPPIKCVRIDGSTLPKRKHELKEAFQAPGSDVQVAVVGITAAGVGLTFTAAHTAVFAELHWTPGILFQAEDRVHRIGQRAAHVDIHYLNSGATGTDAEMWAMVARKLDNLQQTLDAGVSSAAPPPPRAPVRAAAGAGGKRKAAAAADDDDGDGDDLEAAYGNIGDADAVPMISGLASGWEDGDLDDGGGGGGGSSSAAASAGAGALREAAAVRNFFFNAGHAAGPQQTTLQFSAAAASAAGGPRVASTSAAAPAPPKAAQLTLRPTGAPASSTRPGAGASGGGGSASAPSAASSAAGGGARGVTAGGSGSSSAPSAPAAATTVINLADDFGDDYSWLDS